MADNLNDTKDIVAELEELLGKSVEHAKKLPMFMRKLLGITDEVVQLEEEIARLKEEGAEAADEETDSTKRGIEGKQAARDLIQGQLQFMSGFVDQSKAAVATITRMVGGLGFVNAVLLGIVAYAADFLRTMSKVREEIGGSVLQAAELAVEIQRAQRFSALLFFDGELVRKTAKAIVDEFGTLNAVTATSVQNIGEFAKLSGASVTDVVKLARLFDTLAISSEDAAQNLKDASFEAGILVDQAFNEIATQAEFFATFTDESAKNIQNALVFAKQLGTTLEATNRISEKLLDVESAITNQFKLSAILGRQINVEEAIRLNFLGQTDRAQEVVVSQIRQAVAELGGFNRLLPIQRRELATTFESKSPPKQGEYPQLLPNDVNKDFNIGNPVSSPEISIGKARGSLKISDFSQGDIFHTQPYVNTPIRAEVRFPLTQIVNHKVRVGKFLDSDEGILFIGKQSNLQQFNAMPESFDGSSASGGKYKVFKSDNTVFSPLGIRGSSTPGFHIERHKIDRTSSRDAFGRFVSDEDGSRSNYITQNFPNLVATRDRINIQQEGQAVKSLFNN